jgi:L,D-transpeptidase YcbB
MRMRMGAALLAAALMAACSGGAKEREQVNAALRQALAASTRPPYVTADADGRKLWKLTQQFYERRRHVPAWIDGNDPRPQMAELMTALEAASHEGLDPQLYSVRHLEARRQDARKGFLTKKGFDPEEAGELDAWLSYLYLKYASDLADGLSDLAHAESRWQIKPEKFDAVSRLEQALASNTVRGSLDGLTPPNPQYQALRKALADYRAQVARGGWPRLPAGLRLKPHQRSPHVATLAKRLAASGDYAPSSGAHVDATYSPALQEAVRHFQRRHGMPDDGVVTPKVVAELNVPLETRIQQIELNLERWRWLPRDLGPRYLLVNIPEYRLEVWEGDRVPLTMRVVVGKGETPTPIFNDVMTHVVFSPYWHVPAGIAQDETLPEVLTDPGFLARTNMEVIDASGKPVDASLADFSDPTRYRFRQRPGAGNSLGLVKFMFPNQHNVYLHDTPANSLFARASRSFSHGCVRVQEPVALAEYVLRDQSEWTRARIEEAMHAGEEQHVKLRTPLPVYLGYWTARAGSEGAVQFRADVYGIDARQRALLTDRLNRLRKSAAASVAAQSLRGQERSGAPKARPAGAERGTGPPRATAQGGPGDEVPR